MNAWRFGLVALLFGLAAGSARADDTLIRLTSLEWPPYVGEAVERQGASIAVVRAAAEAMGYRVEVCFLPWGQQAAEVINAGLQKIDAAAISAKFFE
jgi:polar amino acid transport system substrate-binding protein